MGKTVYLDEKYLLILYDYCKKCTWRKRCRMDLGSFNPQEAIKCVLDKVGAKKGEMVGVS
jgi:hypothetical protein